MYSAITFSVVSERLRLIRSESSVDIFKIKSLETETLQSESFIFPRFPLICCFFRSTDSMNGCVGFIVREMCLYKNFSDSADSSNYNNQKKRKEKKQTNQI